PRIYDIFPLRSHRAAKDPSVPIFDGWRGALPVLSAAVVDFGIYRIWLGISDRGGCIDVVDYVVLPLFPRGRCAHADDRRRARRRLYVSLYHFAAAGLCLAHGRNRSL